VSKETYCSVNRDLRHSQKRPTIIIYPWPRRSSCSSTSVKRDLRHSQKRPTIDSGSHRRTVSTGVKRDLRHSQKRPTIDSGSHRRTVSTSVKRDLRHSQKRPTINGIHISLASTHVLLLVVVNKNNNCNGIICGTCALRRDLGRTLSLLTLTLGLF
jgi:hypothetical protein